MGEDEHFEIDRDVFRRNMNRYSIKAFEMLPEMERPRILDIGCGTGEPAMELAKLSDGEIIGIDIDQAALDKFVRKIEQAGLTDRVKARRLSLLQMDFQEQSFDVIWSEGTIIVVGFEKGLREWGRLLKPGGFLVVHDEIKNRKKKLELISSCGYRLLGQIELPAEVWLKGYLEPLRTEMDRIKKKHGEKPAVKKELEKAQKEIDLYEKNPSAWASIFFVMQKS